MRLIPTRLIISLFFTMSSAFAGTSVWHQTIWNPGEKTQIPLTDFNQIAATPAVFVIGEEHYNPSVQLAEAWLMATIADQMESKDQLVFGWEFLNTEDRFAIDDQYSRFQNQSITTAEFLQQLFPAGPSSMEYAPVMESARAYDMRLIPTNLSRAQKSPVTRGGLEALDPALLPEDFTLGGAFYRERFREAMGSHPLPHPLDNYFAAQSLTDEVMATELLNPPLAGSRILITGSFHGDYRDGVVASLERRVKNLPVLYIRIIDASVFTQEQLLQLFIHPRYGPIADILFVVNEPRR